MVIGGVVYNLLSVATTGVIGSGGAYTQRAYAYSGAQGFNCRVPIAGQSAATTGLNAGVTWSKGDCLQIGGSYSTGFYQSSTWTAIANGLQVKLTGGGLMRCSWSSTDIHAVYMWFLLDYRLYRY